VSARVNEGSEMVGKVEWWWRLGQCFAAVCPLKQRQDPELRQQSRAHGAQCGLHTRGLHPAGPEGTLTALQLEQTPARAFVGRRAPPSTIEQLRSAHILDCVLYVRPLRRARRGADAVYDGVI
jgi:hypothetical protein